MMTENKHVVKQWYEREDAIVEGLVTPKLVENVVFLAGISDDDETLNLTALALTEALKAFKWAWFNQDDLHSESAENKALEEAASNAAKLYDNLSMLQDYSGLEGRLEDTIKKLPTLYKLDDGQTLRNLISTGQNIFAAYRELLVDLQVCLEGTSNRQPKRHILEGFDGEDPIDLETDEEFASRMQEWRARSKARALPKEHALQEFLKTLRPFWEANSVHPFTEGMHFKEANQTISNLVDAVESIMAVASPRTSRSQIVTAIREVRRPSS
jgi:hypothetical protein